MNSNTTIHSVEWSALFPVLLLIRAARIAFRPTILLVATLGLWLSSCGWWLSDRLFFEKPVADVELIDLATMPAKEINELEQTLLRASLRQPLGTLSFPGLGGMLGMNQNVPPYVDAMRFGPVQQFALRFNLPGGRFFTSGLTFAECCYLFCGLLLQLAVWGFVGAVVTRLALVELATGEPADLIDAFQFSLGKYLFHFSAPLFPLLGVALLALPMFFLGLVMRLDLGVLLAGILWILLIPLGIIAAWLLVGLALGWPLLWGGVSAEPDGDHFGATSRMYAYVYQRPLHYLWYVLVAIVLGVLAGWIVNRLADTTIETLHWGASWGAGAERMAKIETGLAAGATEGGTLAAGIRVMRWAERLVAYMAGGFGAGFFWCSFAGIYLLMRKAVDDKELDEVYLDYDDLRPASVTETPPASAAASKEPTPPPTDPLPPPAEENPGS